LVDVINSFFDPRGEAYYAEAQKVLAPISALLDQARRSDAFIVHAVERHFPQVKDHEGRRLPEHCLIGSLDAEYVSGIEPIASARELELPKRRFSAFLGTDLDFLLRANDVTGVLVVGVKTNVCVRATSQDAFGHGFDVAVCREATNSNRPHLAEASLEDIDSYMGRVVDLKEAMHLVAGRDTNE
jgi:nicotinamidase-related amidase